MKKLVNNSKVVIIILVSMIIGTLNGYSINNYPTDSIVGPKLVKQIDEMDDKTYLFASYKFVVANEEKTIGFIVQPNISDDYNLQDMIGTIVGLGSCNENDELIILFDNGEKVKLHSWKKFNCKGAVYFSIDDDTYNLLKNHKLMKIKITNGRTFQSFTKEVPSKYQTYFIQLIKELETKNISKVIKS
jgi:hypothetical protein